MKSIKIKHINAQIYYVALNTLKVNSVSNSAKAVKILTEANLVDLKAGMKVAWDKKKPKKK